MPARTRLAKTTNRTHRLAVCRLVPSRLAAAVTGTGGDKPRPYSRRRLFHGSAPKPVRRFATAARRLRLRPSHTDLAWTNRRRSLRSRHRLFHASLHRGLRLARYSRRYFILAELNGAEAFPKRLADLTQVTVNLTSGAQESDLRLEVPRTETTLPRGTWPSFTNHLDSRRDSVQGITQPFAYLVNIWSRRLANDCRSLLVNAGGPPVYIPLALNVSMKSRMLSR